MKKCECVFQADNCRVRGQPMARSVGSIRFCKAATSLFMFGFQFYVVTTTRFKAGKPLTVWKRLCFCLKYLFWPHQRGVTLTPSPSLHLWL